jgi:hypothetical protein
MSKFAHMSLRQKIAFLFVFFSGIGLSQSEKAWGLEARFKAGFLAAHRGVMGHLPKEHAFAGELTYFVKTKGEKEWHEAVGYPVVGATLFGGSVGNQEILGNYFGSYGFIEFPFIRKRGYEFSGKLGAGLGYGTKVFDETENPKNVAMSSHLNALICIGVKQKFMFGRNGFTLGLDMTHFSNGASKVPNLGLNLPYLSLGYVRDIRSKQIDSVYQANKIEFRKWMLNTTAIVSFKEIFPTSGRKYPVYVLNSSFRWFSRPKVGVEFGLDLISKQAVLGYKPEIQKSQWDIFQIGIYSAYLLPLDQFHFAFGMGYYVKDKFQPEDPMYHRISMRYHLKNGMNFNIGLKSHWARADYVEWGVGYNFKLKR